ncbi:hypothetical protein FRC06_009315 [Ceratobasidium sp. 370]|nr:hypothetical protein FRC06_009315 [Ceratobasidium sp. 370]
MEEMVSHLINQVEVDQILQEEADQEEADPEEEEEDLQDLLQDGLEQEDYPIGLSSLQEDLHQDPQVGHQDLQADHQDLQEDHRDHQDLQGLAEIITIIGSMDHKALEAMSGLQDLQDQRMLLTSEAKEWFEQFSGVEQQYFMTHWDDFKYRMGQFFWTPTWIANAKSKAYQAKYRESKHSNETPSQFLIRKKELIDAVHQWNDVDIIGKIAKSAPHQWRTIVDHEQIAEWSLYLSSIKEKEDLLQDWSSHAYKSEKKSKCNGRANVHAVNSFKPKASKDSDEKKKPPPDDRNVTKRKAGTPEATPEEQTAYAAYSAAAEDSDSDFSSTSDPVPVSDSDSDLSDDSDNEDFQ